MKIFLLPALCFSQTVSISDTSDISNLSLEDLMKYKSHGIPSELESKINAAIEVASLNPLSSRKSPSIVSVITSAEIQHSGARDLIDILRLVPGIDFGVDVLGSIGIAIRGNWASEGKVLLQIDGMEINENVSGTLQFANRYPIDQIKRIEIIRGPGSAIYGGDAEFAVINIITKSASDLNGVQVNATYGRMKHALAENNYTIAIGKKLKDLNLKLTAFLGQSNRSDMLYTDIYGNSYDMAKNSKILPVNFNLGFNYKGLTIHAFYDKMLLETRDAFDMALNHAYKEHFTTIIADAEYVWKISDKFSWIPKLSFKGTTPWEISAFPGYDSVEASDVLYKTVADRLKFNLTSINNISKNINITAGFESFYDKGKKFNGDIFRNSGKAEVSYFNTAVFVQAIIKNEVANLTLGGRFDYNSSFGSDFVPRVGLTKRIGKFNFKLLYSNSFRAPAIENVENSISGKIKPEDTYIWEFESGWQINKDMFITFNLFDLTTHNTIVYFIDTTVVGVPDGYLNRDKGGSQGIELEYKFIGKWGYTNLGYSFYTTRNKSQVPEYAAPGDKSEALAFPNHKISLNTSFNLTRSLCISPSFTFYSERDGIAAADPNGNYIYKEFPRTFYANVFIERDNFFVTGLRAGIGVYDMFNQKAIYIQPYSSGHAPLPGASREFSVRLNYNFHFKEARK